MTATEQLANQWSTDGQFSFMDYLSRETMDAYRKEAEGVFSDRQRKGVRAVETRRDGSFASPSQFGVHTGGPQLVALLRDKGMLEQVRDITGNGRLIPVRCSYNFYDPGDFMGIHRDEVRATVTGTFSITPDMPPTKYVAGSREMTNEQLEEYVSAHGSLPEDGEDMPLEAQSLNFFDGYNIAHWRPVVDRPMILGNLVYFQL